MLTFISTPTDLVAQISGVATGILGDFAPYAALIIGVGLGLWILGWLIDKIRGKEDYHWFTEGGGFESDPSLTEADKAYYRRKYPAKSEDEI